MWLGHCLLKLDSLKYTVCINLLGFVTMESPA